MKLIDSDTLPLHAVLQEQNDFKTANSEDCQLRREVIVGTLKLLGLFELLGLLLCYYYYSYHYGYCGCYSQEGNHPVGQVF